MVTARKDANTAPLATRPFRTWSSQWNSSCQGCPRAASPVRHRARRAARLRSIPSVSVAELRASTIVCKRSESSRMAPSPTTARLLTRCLVFPVRSGLML